MYYVRYCSYIKSQCAVVGMGRIRAYRASQPQVHFKQIFLGNIGVVWHSIFFFTSISVVVEKSVCRHGRKDILGRTVCPGPRYTLNKSFIIRVVRGSKRLSYIYVLTYTIDIKVSVP